MNRTHSPNAMNALKTILRLMAPRGRRESEKRGDERIVTRVPADIVLEDGGRQRVLVVDVSRSGLQLVIEGQNGGTSLRNGALRLHLYDLFAEGERSRVEAAGDISYQRALPGGDVRVGVRLHDALDTAMVAGTEARLAIPAEWEAQIQRLIEQIHLDLPGERCRSIVLTSTIPGEGVTTIARWLAMALARNAESRVLYVDANLGPVPVGGLAQPSPDGAPADPEVLHTPLSNFDILPFGKPEAQSLVRRPEGDLKLAMDRLRERYDFIVIDGAATAVSPFTFVLARNADGVFLVVSIGESERESVAQAVEQVGRYGGRLLGVVVNHKRPG